ncbi:hypothetical protein [Leadbettera azotonutricia]|uniref:hypothetical protein n=1 Tax=Leadbettera azotonutricia TaxID=150829 RepID=UPI0011D2BD93|nr:hypothetical protein [Leadbettera azotonutricia]
MPFCLEIASAEPSFTWGLLWSGSWANSFRAAGQAENQEAFSGEDIFAGGTLANRGDFNFGLPNLGLLLRVQAVDKRVLPPDDARAPIFTPGFGIYYDGSGPVGSFLGKGRLLRGVLDEEGLPARIRNVWVKSAPFVEKRKPAMSELKTEASSSKESETCLYLGLPQWGHFSGYASTRIDDDLNPAFGFGVETNWGDNYSLGFDGFYTQKELAARKASGWFSAAPPLPERDFRFWAFGAAFNTQNFGLASDLALSEAFAFGRDMYGNAAIRIGDKPWRFSLAADAAGSRYVDRGGAAPGAGFRMASRLERRWVRSGSFRFDTVFRSPGFGEIFNRGEASIYFRPSAPSPKNRLLFHFSRASLALSRDARVPLKTEDSLQVMAGFNFGSWRTSLSGALHGRSIFDVDENPLPFPLPPAFETFESFKAGGELNWSKGIVSISAKTGYTIKAEKENIWDIAVNASVKPGKWGRVGLKIASDQFPEKWNYTLTWRLETNSR